MRTGNSENNSKKGKCCECSGKIFFHVGDKISFGGNKTYHSHPEIRAIAENSGLLMTGSQKHVRVIVLNPNGALKRHYSEAEKISDKVMTPQEFKRKSLKVCTGKLPAKKRKPSFRSLLVPGNTIYCYAIDSRERRQVEKLVKAYGARITERKTRGVSAVIANRKAMTRGRNNFFQFLEVPVYFIDKIL